MIELPPDARVLVCGGRGYDNASFVSAVLDWLRPREVVHGGATGADSLAAAWCRRHQVTEARYPADWRRYGRSAGPRRNQQMLATQPDLVVAFRGGAGTADMVARARLAGLSVLDLADEVVPWATT